ncbi:hypothetical protein [Methylovulum sp.]|uniref:hypothetical protein n=1 Tax=Methylovulum sp. TaxID=1916980 RepID=UPI002606DB61|nr:hypothetical protein [Methylovulum sp.]MDD5123391.1 hypothetical protein [Methylovulum sp.]
MKFIFLDRNAISCIKENLAGKKPDPEMLKRLRKLRQFDKESFIVSPMLSIIEGQIGKREDEEQKLNTIKVESAAVSDFFLHARTDSGFIEVAANEIANIFSENIEGNWVGYIDFLKVIQEMLYQSISKANRPKYKSDILQLAKKNNIPLAHPIVICCLAVLYGNNDVRSILKPKKNIAEDSKNKAAYNALNDILLISRLGHIQAVFNKYGNGRVVVEFLTFDKGLEFFLKKTKIIDIKLNDDGEVFITAISSQEFFPDLNESSHIALFDELREKS